MTKRHVGDRVGAIRNADDETVFLYGYGVYDGDFEPPCGPFGITREQWEEAAGAGVPFPMNPRITLDGGGVVWGQQCWWGDEVAVQKAIAGRVVVIVPPETVEP